MGKKIAVTGYSGPKVRSDCEVTLELRIKGGITIDLTSKVRVLYGESIKSLCREMMDFFRIRHAKITINDTGALPFVIAARIEAAVNMLQVTEEYLPEMIRENTYSTTKDRFRFSRLYLPGNNPGLMINAGLHSSDGIILDLEDSVAPVKKDEARILVRNALRQIDFRGAERMVRINQGEAGIRDLRSVIPHNVNMILIPKCESHEQVMKVDNEIGTLRKKYKIKDQVLLMPIIESALGIENSFEIAKSSENVASLAIGLEDYTADLGVPRTIEGKESFYARTRLISAAKAAGIQPVDSVFSDVLDMEGLRQSVQNSKALGFEGMGCIHPRQIAIINAGFTPDTQEIEKSKKIVIAYDEALKQGLGVVALGSKMIDMPVVTRARKTITLAVRTGKLAADWKKEFIASGN